jgi:hypothetical protein
MAKKQDNGNHYEPGIIYDLGIMINGLRTPFYVGETSNPEQRLKDHQRAGKNADDDSTLVYRTIKDFDQAGIAWDMKELDKYGNEGPTDLEDEWIMRHLYDGYILSNMKKGNKNWMAERQAVAGDMKKRGIRSYKKYKEVLTQEDADRKHAQWMAEQQAIDRREAERKRALELVAQQQAEKIRQHEIEKAKEAKRIAEQQARWEAERPAREAKLKAEAERLQAEETARQECEEANRRELRRIEDQTRSELEQRANQNYGDWPDLEDRLRHQRSEDVEVKVMLAAGYTSEQIEYYLAKDKKMHWPPSRIRT